MKYRRHVLLVFAAALAALVIVLLTGVQRDSSRDRGTTATGDSDVHRTEAPDHQPRPESVPARPSADQTRPRANATRPSSKRSVTPSDTQAPLPAIADMKRVSAGELTQLEPGLASQFQARLRDTTAGSVRTCVDEYRQRRSDRDAGSVRIEHTLLLSISARRGQAVVRHVEGDEGWPGTFDAPLQECLVSAYGEAEFDADRDYDYTFEWPLVIR